MVVIQGVGFDPLPTDFDSHSTPVQINNLAYNSKAKGYEGRTDSLSIAHPFDEFQAALPLNRVADLGCGPGRDLDYMLSVGLQVVGVDPSAAMRQLAQKRLTEHIAEQANPIAYLRERGYNQDTVEAAVASMTCNGTMDTLPVGKEGFAPGSFGGLWVVTSLQHLPPVLLSDFLSPAQELLTESGQFYIKTRAPFEGQPPELYECLQTSGENEGGSFTRYFAYYEPEQLIGALEEQGFNITQTSHHPENSARIDYPSIVNGIDGFKFWVLAEKR